ncbi:hypothetical protein B0H19DRAFT_1097007 [Mycena capillaripes]|nr:hypothetical protein B0H19DRAFT_1097007 [Mycena capillaripes]
MVGSSLTLPLALAPCDSGARAEISPIHLCEPPPSSWLPTKYRKHPRTGIRRTQTWTAVTAVCYLLSHYPDPGLRLIPPSNYCHFIPTIPVSIIIFFCFSTQNRLAQR